MTRVGGSGIIGFACEGGFACQLKQENLTAEYEQTNKTITLTWNYSPLAKERTWYMIYKAVGEGDFKEHKSVDAATFSYVDNGVKPGNIKYGIVVMTSHGGESEMMKNSLVIPEE